jgi:hypothetical protein
MDQENKDTIEKMRQLIEEKKKKNASPGKSRRGGESGFFGSHPGNKRQKKGGLPPK